MSVVSLHGDLMVAEATWTDDASIPHQLLDHSLECLPGETTAISSVAARDNRVGYGAQVRSVDDVGSYRQMPS